jgi:integrase
LSGGSPTEIKTFWEGLDNAKMSEGVRLSLKFMLVTSQRRGEVTSAPWAEFDLENEVWEIPGMRTKNGHKHRVPLSRFASNLLADIRRQSDDPKWLFPSPHHDKPITPGAVSHALRNNLSRIGIQGVTAHDLRRTAASSMTELGISRLVVAKLLNHPDKSITSIYDRHSYGPEKKHALDAWGARLESIIAGQGLSSNVVELQRAIK